MAPVLILLVMGGLVAFLQWELARASERMRRRRN